MSEIEKRQVCKCENCGNEAEMVVTCSLPDVDPEDATVSTPETPKASEPVKRVMGTGTCSHCGNESDRWIDF